MNYLNYLGHQEISQTVCLFIYLMILTATGKVPNFSLHFLGTLFLSSGLTLHCDVCFPLDWLIILNKATLPNLVMYHLHIYIRNQLFTSHRCEAYAPT